MKNSQAIRLRLALLAGCASVALAPTIAVAQTSQAFVAFDIPAQDLDSALTRFGQQSEREIIISSALTRNRQAPAVQGSLTPEAALNLLLADSGLTYRVSSNGALIVENTDPQSGSAAGDGADGTVEALIVTAQKREEDIQDVPIAISAFTQEDLTRSQVAGGPDLITQVPNMTFTKTNFSSYSIQIRGIGTQAISATTDAAVAVAFNNTPFIRNRFFEQEFYDLQRVEVLRGPQGTLYGRNATAGVVNIISAKPKFLAESKLSADVSNFNSTRIEGMVNIPLVEDKVALRLAGAWTKRDGYATNELTGNPIDGRDLWSTRLSLRFAPTDAIDANLIWEHFQEDDDRLRSGKQLCKKDVVTEVGGFQVGYFDDLPGASQSLGFSGVQGTLSQGCARESLYSDASFQTPVGLMLPYYVPLGAVGLPVARQDPYVSTIQSRDLRVIESTIDPNYKANADLGELQISVDLSDGLTLASETAYSTDFVYSLQDFNRFNTAPGAWKQPETFDPRPGVLTHGENGGVFCDPQLGCSDRLVAVDISTARSRQFSQELRISSDFDGPFNFSLGANYLRYDTEDKYYVFINSLSLIAANNTFANDAFPYVGGVSDNVECLPNGMGPGNPIYAYPVVGCIYMDPNPIDRVNDHGHNYFLSRNPYKLISYAVFGEAYYDITESLKITGGLRWTVDKKDAPRIPTWVLAGLSAGYPVAEVIEQEWREPTGRLAIDWKPDPGFTDETLIYGSYAHGYKAGGANPPGYVRVLFSNLFEEIPVTQFESVTRPKTFDPEFVDAFELGAKNTLLDGKVTLNLAAFYYDYKAYQISEIVDRSAFNRNFDATVWGVEVEADWRPMENLRLGFKGGYEKTRIADGEAAVDLMDRTAGRDDWVLVRPFPTYASSCILPAYMFVGSINGGPLRPINVGGAGGGNPGGCEVAYLEGRDPVTQLPYVEDPVLEASHGTLERYTDYPGFNPFDESQGHNFGEGFTKQLGGNELPNAPNWTGTITADYTVPLPNDWLATLHTDLHWQSESWWRVFNDHEYGKLDEYFTMNLAAIFVNEEARWNIMAYIKNVTDETAITGAFLNSDDTGLTTNVFLTEPRLYGLRVTKAWTGGPLLGSFGARRESDGSYPITLELGGQVQRHNAPGQAVRTPSSGNFSPVVDIADDMQRDDLDWGDGREVKLTWRPSEGPWHVSTAARVGKTNRASTLHAEEETEEVCAYGGPQLYLCPSLGPAYYFSQTNWSDNTVHRREEHGFIDFVVGRDMGMGSFGYSTIAAGLRYGQFKSTTSLDVDAIPNWVFVDGWYNRYDPSFTRYQAVLDASREFEGVGPIVTWDASRRLLGALDGHLDIDWSITGGVLFGKQKSRISGVEDASLYEPTGYDILRSLSTVAVDADTTPVNVRRSDSATALTFGAALGLSYGVGGFKVGAGYRWERYFDVLDTGNTEHESADRTIDGPYFKIAVGFGG